ncbi:trans-2,3-dihydro-3-hydroxyanthranilate isomerase [Breznakia sp. PF5-3]|uniref:PhzF family phenazine biosynthesis protein n=1 Tax=unclassified Breznakia TaxID=2623764 RepID=UPI00240644C6|nr:MULTISPECIES: PhzF family phenazine biosynthesis isomerase [unclassified Breznakia]MDF9825209.1 trans-2,3-dihydro-3-hydroxyanthranilate isomerase [Breznakia sp. PM6-1]MDF9836090.1 trans-2,3-dihydro-3-hydroxyanthranilate isomerase [Breznakia sp. PF5-3]MDF9838656.1 trans-2,3-dihydro-3-hydroxyanthranilate isomerase [Breznakia sp. PFB2-8]MDF9860687.1 trans-2,3-dihydro-3-hydroxyanthranilate isomerase [Breznakia sp. PH5-24]
MKQVNVYQIDAFTTIPGQGNPAGVIPDGDQYSDEEMQKIAHDIGFNECVFICKSKQADIYLRYFTPGYETPLCGHATMAAIFYLAQAFQKDHVFKIETKAGLLDINYKHKTKAIEMQHAKPKTILFDGNKEQLCASLHISTNDLCDLPIVYGNTGSWTLLVPVKSEAILDKMKADNEQFPSLLNAIPKSSVHPFSITDKDKYIFHARHFSSPFSKTKEDSVTGTASGVMGVYALDYIYSDIDELFLNIYQGKQVNKEGNVKVSAIRNPNGHDIKIYGTAIFNMVLQTTI